MNPFITGRALDGERSFFGRAALLRQIEAELRSPEQVAVVLCGPRRIGKSSLLFQLQRFLPSPSFLPVYFDLMGCGERPLPALLFEQAAAVAREAGLEPPGREDFVLGPESFEGRFLPDLFRALGEECRPVLLLDQLDLLEAGQRTGREGARSLLSYLRQLLQREPRLGMVFVVERTADALPAELQALLKGARWIAVPPLEEPAARALLALLRHGGGPTLTLEAAERVLALAGYHPYFLQLLGHALWEQAHSRTAGPPALLDVAAVDEAVQPALRAGAGGLAWIWGGLAPAERVVLAAMAGARRPQVSKAQLGTLLDRGDVPLLDGRLLQAPDALVRAGLLREVDGGYRFVAPLLRRWVASCKPLGKVKEELAPEVPLAQSLHRSAKGLYRRRSLEGVPELLRHALRLDPTLLEARLLLGEALLDAGQCSQAVQELEEAHRRAPEIARAPLVRALLACAEEQARTGQPRQAIATYGRVLELCPQEGRAAERRQELWRQLGNEALAAGELDQAEAAYREAGAQEQAEAIEPVRRQRAQAHVLRRAEEHAARREWSQAVALYEQLAAEQPEEPRWQEALACTRTELELERLYSAATVALARGEREQALHALATLISLRPGYRDADRLLARAARRPVVRAAGPWRLAWVGALIVGLSGGALLSLGLGQRMRSPQTALAHPPTEASAQRALLLADSALLEQRWEDARREAERILAQPALPPALRSLAEARRSLAEREQAARTAYDLFLRALGRDLDEALRRYAAIPAGSPYQALAREARDRMLAADGADRLRRAEAARGAGRCQDFRALVQQVLARQPSHPEALQLRQKTCRDGSQAVALARALAAPAPAVAPAHAEGGGRGAPASGLRPGDPGTAAAGDVLGPP